MVKGSLAAERLRKYAEAAARATTSAVPKPPPPSWNSGLVSWPPVATARGKTAPKVGALNTPRVFLPGGKNTAAARAIASSSATRDPSDRWHDMTSEVEVPKAAPPAGKAIPRVSQDAKCEPFEDMEETVSPPEGKARHKAAPEPWERRAPLPRKRERLSLKRSHRFVQSQHRRPFVLEHLTLLARS